MKKYKWLGHSIFCPVGAAISIIHRALLLRIPSDEPIGAWSPDDGSSFRFVHATHVTSVMRDSVVMAYTNPNHYLRINISRICPHSNRVPAAVCLQRAKATNDEIAFKLRWHPTSVPTYLRDCFDEVGEALEDAFQDVMNITFPLESSPASASFPT